MKDEGKTKKQLIEELEGIRQRLAEMEAVQATHVSAAEVPSPSEEKYRLLAENVSDVIWTMDMRRRFTYVSPSVSRTLGYSVDEVMNMPFGRVLTPSSIRTVAQALRRHRDEGGGQEKVALPSRALEIELVRKDGSTLWSEVTMSFLRDPEGQPNGILGVARDISERRGANEAILFAAQEWRHTLDAINDVVCLMNLEGKVLRCNRAMTRLVGKPFGEILNRPCWELVHGTSASVDGCPFVRMRETGRRESAVLAIRDRWFNIVVDPRVDGSGSPVGAVHVMSDITGRKRAEEEKQRLEVQLFQSQKMEALGTLAAGIAHDFNNLLTAIYGNVQLVLEEIPEADPLQMNLSRIKDASVQATALVRKLMLFCSSQPTVFTTRDINKVVSDMMKMLERIIGEDVVVHVAPEPNVWSVRADAAKLEQVLMNLAINARDAMPKGGDLTVKTENVVIGKRDMEGHSEAREGNFVCLSVRDTGVGMSPEILSRIFEPFFTTKRVGRGTGLGLSVAHGIVKEHKGWIAVESSPGNGATFRIYLPTSGSVPEEEKEMEPVVTLPSLRGNGERILVVEDDESVRDFLRRGLSKNGYQVSDAASAKEAFAIFENEGRNVDLLFSDIVLPDDTGPRLAELFLKLKPGIGVLLSSGYSDEESNWLASQRHKCVYLPKPYSLEDLLKSVRGALEKREQPEKLG
ncbi:MAG: PAS domain S-box protein [bacterium]|nr:PAS domain S-box protein [bacterium]